MAFGLSSIFNSEIGLNGEGWRLCANLIKLIILPVALTCGFVEWIAWRIGDTKPPALIAQMQTDDPTLLWGGAGQFFAPVKIAAAERQKPDIIVVGDSRSGQLRSAMFKPYSFYNCTMAAWTFEQDQIVLDRILQVYTPKVVIFNLDYFMFSSAYEDHWNRYAKMDLDYRHVDGLRAFLEGAAGKPLDTLSVLPGVTFGRKLNADGTWVLGSPAIRDGSSTFRHDGSLDYSSLLRNTAGTNVKYLLNVLGQVEAGSGTRIDPAQMRRLREFAGQAKQHGITLIGVQLPILQAALDILDAGQDFHQLSQFYGSDMAIWRQFEGQETKALFQSMGVIFDDLARIPESADPRYFIDAAHPGEYAVLAAVVQMLKDPRARAALPEVDISALERELSEPTDNYFDVYYNRF